MNTTLVNPALNWLLQSGVIDGYSIVDCGGERGGMEPYQTLTINFNNGESLTITSRGGCEESSWLNID